MTDWYTDGDRRGENDQIFDLPALAPNATIAEVMDWIRMLAQWIRTREPVAEGSIFAKYMTYGAAVRLGLLDENDLIGDDGDPGDGNDDPGNVDDTFVDVYARDMVPSVTSGCGALATLELDSTKPNLHVLEFDPTTEESAQFALLMPRGWVGGAIQFRVYWSHSSGATAFGVKWRIEPQAFNDHESMDVSWNGGKDVSDTGGTADMLYISPFSQSVRIDPSVTDEGDLIVFKISRIPTDSEDTLDIDARLHAIRFNTGTIEDDFPPPPSDYVLLMSFDGDFSDKSHHNFIFSGTGSIATDGSAYKWSSGSLLFNGVDRVSSSYHVELYFGSRKWSVDFWIYIPSSVTLGTDNTVVCVWTAIGTISWYIGISSFGLLRLFTSTDGTTPSFWNASSTVIPRDSWVHVAVWNNQIEMRSSINGAAPYGIATSATLYNAITGLSIGATGAGDGPMPAGVRIDELRICIDEIDYDSTGFALPVAPYP